MPSVVANDALRLAGRARCVEDVERVGSGNGDTIGRVRIGEPIDPIMITAGRQGRFCLGSLQHDHVCRLVVGDLERRIEQRLVLDDPAGLETA